MSPFSAPFSWGTRKRRLLLPRRAAALSEGTQWGMGGTGKAEDAKLLDAGISLKQCPGNERQKKGWPTELGRSVQYRASYRVRKKAARSFLSLSERCKLKRVS